MLKEFFTRPGDRVVAWGGLLIAVGHVLIGAVIKVLINSFFKGFYNTLEHAGDSNLTTVELLQEQGSVDSQLQYFCVLAGVSAAIHPFASYIRNIWTMRWRLALVDSYLANFSERSAAVEGSSQRLQEDTQRFAKGVDMFLLVFLDATLTLVLFLPVLFDLGKTVQCSHGALCVFGDGWVGAIASSSAALAMIGALFLGRKLVGLEVNNQRVEAAFRKKLVHVESQSELTNSFGTNISDSISTLCF
jgi:peptide/bleomycin uptake transporter